MSVGETGCWGRSIAARRRVERFADDALQKVVGSWRLEDGRPGCVVHVGHGHDDLDVDVRWLTGVDDFDGAVAAQEAGNQLAGMDRGGEPDALETAVSVVRNRKSGFFAGAGHLALQSFERQRHVHAALGRRKDVDLVDDHGVDRQQRRGRLRAEDQEQRLGRGDQDVVGLARLLAAVAG